MNRLLFGMHAFLAFVFTFLTIFDIYKYLGDPSIWILGQIILNIVCAVIWFILLLFDIKEVANE